MEQKIVKAKWEIDEDGYYPYCSNCGYEPARDSFQDLTVRALCPKCKSQMVNSELLYKQYTN